MKAFLSCFDTCGWVIEIDIVPAVRRPGRDWIWYFQSHDCSTLIFDSSILSRPTSGKYLALSLRELSKIGKYLVEYCLHIPLFLFLFGIIDVLLNSGNFIFGNYLPKLEFQTKSVFKTVFSGTCGKLLCQMKNEYLCICIFVYLCICVFVYLYLSPDCFPTNLW